MYVCVVVPSVRPLLFFNLYASNTSSQLSVDSESETVFEMGYGRAR